MSLSALPSVAKSFVMFCSKCNGEKFHTVMTHTSADSAKVICEICKKRSTYKLGSDKPKKVIKVKSSSLSGNLVENRDDHNMIYIKLIEEANQVEPKPYNVKAEFGLRQKIQHVKFGLGVVNRVLDDRVEVVFADEVRQLVHRRT